MSKSIIEALYHGEICPNERKRKYSSERKKTEQKIESERNHFKNIVSHDDWVRFENLESLYSETASDDEIDSFSHGFTLGAQLILELIT